MDGDLRQGAGAPAIRCQAVTTLSEAESKTLVAAFGIPIPDERIVADVAAAVEAANAIGYPVVLKLNGDAIAHKTERGLVRLNVRDADRVAEAGAELLAAATAADGPVSLLVAPMLKGNRELIAGLHHDEQFGPTVMLGVGGILTEAIADVAFRLVPLTTADAEDLMDDLQTQKLLGPFRGEPAIDRAALVQIITGLAALAEARPDIASVDLNPLIVVDGIPIAVDALVEVNP